MTVDERETKEGIPVCDSCSKTLLYYYNKQFMGTTQAIFRAETQDNLSSQMSVLNFGFCIALRNTIKRKGDRALGRSHLEATRFSRQVIWVDIFLLLNRGC